MNTNKQMMIALFTTGLVALPAVASAQDSKVNYGTTGENRPSTNRDMAAAEDDDITKDRMGKEGDKDPIPQAPRPVVTTDENAVAEQAGVGSAIAYSSAGVVEMGGAAGFSMNNSLTTATLSPSIGWFFADNVQISGITNFTYADVRGDDSLSVSALLEPSYHLPFTDTVFGFAGMGAGVSYIEGAGAGFALQPRAGMNFLVGRSGIFTPAVNVGYSTVEADAIGNNRTILTVEPSVGVQAGYTVMW